MSTPSTVAINNSQTQPQAVDVGMSTIVNLVVLDGEFYKQSHRGGMGILKELAIVNTASEHFAHWVYNAPAENGIGGRLAAGISRADRKFIYYQLHHIPWHGGNKPYAQLVDDILSGVKWVTNDTRAPLTLLYAKGAEKSQFFEELAQDAVGNLDTLNVTFTPLCMMDDKMCCAAHEWKTARCALTKAGCWKRDIIRTGLGW